MFVESYNYSLSCLAQITMKKKKELSRTPSEYEAKSGFY